MISVGEVEKEIEKIADVNDAAGSLERWAILRERVIEDLASTGDGRTRRLLKALSDGAARLRKVATKNVGGTGPTTPIPMGKARRKP